MMQQGPAPTPAPIHDIVDMVEIFPFPLWMLLAAGALLLVGLGFLVWLVFFRPKKRRELTARQKALMALAALREKESEATPYEFAVEISDVLRTYIEAAFGIRAVTATSIEFLEEIRHNPLFSEAEKESLKEFLETADLIKFAHVEAGAAELENLVSAAVAVINKEEPAREEVEP